MASQIDHEYLAENTARELSARPVRAANHLAELGGFKRLSRGLAVNRSRILDTLCEVILEQCAVGSAGISILEQSEDGESRLRWPAVAGEWAHHANLTWARSSCPCGIVMDLNATILVQDMHTRFPVHANTTPHAVELLLAPFHDGGTPVGTIWALSHDSQRVFDQEDQRLLLTFADFASLAYQATRAAQPSADLGDDGQFRVMADTIPNHVWTADADGLTDWCNAQSYRYAGAAPGSLLGETWWRLVHPDDVSRARVSWARLVNQRTPYETEVRLRRADGVYRWHLARGVPLDGVSAQRWVGTYTDIEDQKLVAGALMGRSAQFEERIAARTRDLDAVEEALRQSQKMEAVGQLTGGIAHDFNNLLAGILGSLSLIKRRVDAGRVNDIDRFIDAATSSAQRAAALTHRLLAFARRQPLDIQAENVEALIAGMEDMLSRTLGSAIRIEIKTSPALWQAFTDANQFENALLNLAINARDAMPEGGSLEISTYNHSAATTSSKTELAPGDYVVVDVTDTGTGMTAGTLARAFDPFFTTKPIGQGTGLGLSMIYGFLKQSGGYVDLRSVEGSGTTVRLYLPRALVGATKLTEIFEAPLTPGAGETVLLVEDEPSVRLIIGDVLTELGYRKLEASEATGAMELLRKAGPVDLLITDVGLPHINGRQLAEMARALQPQLKVLFVTGYAATVAVRAGSLEPGMDVLAKPFALDLLSKKIRDLLGSRPGVSH